MIGIFLLTFVKSTYSSVSSLVLFGKKTAGEAYSDLEGTISPQSNSSSKHCYFKLTFIKDKIMLIYIWTIQLFFFQRLINFGIFFNMIWRDFLLGCWSIINMRFTINFFITQTTDVSIRSNSCHYSLYGVNKFFQNFTLWYDFMTVTSILRKLICNLLYPFIKIRFFHAFGA